MPTVAQIAAVSYNAVLAKKRKADNQWAESALMKEFERQGFVKRVPGGPQIEAQLDYRRNPGAGFQASDLDPMAMGKTDIITAALYDPAQLSVPVVWSKADESKNPTTNQKIALVKGLLSNAIDSHDDIVEQALFGTVTTGFYGFQTLIPDSGQGTVGGVNAATDTWWRNFSTTYAAAGTDIKSKLTLSWNTAAKGTGSQFHPSLIASDGETQATYEGQEQSNQRWVGTKELDGGFRTIAFKSARWVFSQYGGTRIHMTSPKATQLIVFQGAFRDKGDTQELESGQGYRFSIFSMLQFVQRNKSRCAVLTEA